MRPRFCILIRLNRKVNRSVSTSERTASQLMTVLVTDSRRKQKEETYTGKNKLECFGLVTKNDMP